MLRRYSWPGNVRELRNICERLVVLNDASDVTAQTLTELHVFFTGAAAAAAPLPSHSAGTPELPPRPKKKKDLARELGVSRTTLWRMTKRQEAAEKNGHLNSGRARLCREEVCSNALTLLLCTGVGYLFHRRHVPAGMLMAPYWPPRW